VDRLEEMDAPDFVLVGENGFVLRHRFSILHIGSWKWEGGIILVPLPHGQEEEEATTSRGRYKRRQIAIRSTE
jgi:hypothetical protein